jgi:hypothetical protein
MGFLDLFIERTDEPKKENEKTNSIPKIDFNVSPVSSPSQTPIPVQNIASDDMQKFNQHFDQLFDQANLPGPDYYEFSKMCQAMASLPEESKFSAAFMGLQVQGLTKERLMESANHYIAIIDEDAKKFNSAIDGKILAEVKAKRLESENKQKALQEKINMIAQLQAELAKDTSDIEALNNDAAEQERKAAEKSNTYKAACDVRKSMIATDIQKISAMIK